MRIAIARLGTTRRGARLAVPLVLLFGLLPAQSFGRYRTVVNRRQSAAADQNPEQKHAEKGQAEGGATSAQQPDPADLPSFAPSILDLAAISELTRPRPSVQSQAKKPQKPVSPQSDADQLDKSAITTPLPETKPVGPERTGVNLNQVESLTLQDAIRLALLNNLTIEQYRQGVQIVQYQLFSARGVYDINSKAAMSLVNSSTPTPLNFFNSGVENNTVTSRGLNVNFTATQSIQPTGGQWTVAFNNFRQTTNAVVDLFSPLYVPQFQATLLQPLMRNLSIDANRQAIALDKAQLDLSDSQFRQQVIQIIDQVQDAYWELGFAIQNERIARDTYDLTHKQLEDNKKQMEAGTLAPLDLRQTEATLESNKQTIIAAKQTITTDENNLKVLLFKDPKDPKWNSVVKPLDDPEFAVESFSLSDAIALALKNRPELEQFRLQELQNKINIRFYKNQLKPQVNFTFSYATIGLAGFVPADLSSFVGPMFNGGYGSALKQLFAQDFRTIQVGVTFSFPWRNRTAEGNLGQALAQERQTETMEHAEIQQIGIDVRNSLQAVDAARESYLAAVAGRKAALAQYVGEQEKFKAGLSTTYYVLQQENAYSVALGTEARALANYREALSDFQRYTGTTLVTNNLQLPATSQ
jgi:outer membrane protein